MRYIYRQIYNQKEKVFVSPVLIIKLAVLFLFLCFYTNCSPAHLVLSTQQMSF